MVCGQGQVDYCKENIVKPNSFKKVTQIIEGGAERYDFVYKALLAIVIQIMYLFMMELDLLSQWV